MNTLLDDAHQLALDKLTDVEMIEFAKDRQRLVQIRIELRAHIFSFECHGLATDSRRGLNASTMSPVFGLIVPSPLISCARKSGGPGATFLSRCLFLRPASHFNNYSDGTRTRSSLLRFNLNGLLLIRQCVGDLSKRPTPQMTQCRNISDVQTAALQKTRVGGRGHEIGRSRALEAGRGQLAVRIYWLGAYRSVQGVQLERGISTRRSASPLLDVAH